MIPSGHISNYSEYEVVINKKHFIERLSINSKAWRAFVAYGPYVLFASFVWALSDINAKSTIGKIVSKYNLKNYEVYVYESMIAFFSWSVTNLFIRRFLNPETHDGAISRFFPDAIFGGIASAGQAILKIIFHEKYFDT